MSFWKLTGEDKLAAGRRVIRRTAPTARSATIWGARATRTARLAGASASGCTAVRRAREAARGAGTAELDLSRAAGARVRPRARRSSHRRPLVLLHSR